MSDEHKKRGKIKYKYAHDQNGDIVFVKNLESTPEVRKQTFLCISCGNLLIPRLGKIKQKHFAHKYACDCSPETYLHQLAKEIFFTEYTNCLNNRIPFEIEVSMETYCDAHKKDFGIACHLGFINKKFDITKKYRKILIEKEVEGFIPDICLLTPDGSSKLFIEIFVTHKSSDKKISSGFNIIEVHIESEEDIEVFRSRLISEKDNIIFHGFNIQPIPKNCLGKKDCPSKLRCFRVFKNGKSICTMDSLPKLADFLKTGTQAVEYYEIIDTDDWWSGEDFVSKIIEVYAKGIPVKNCYLCRYQGDNYRWDNEGKPIFCRYLKIRCNSNQAAECKFFRI